MEEYNKLDTNIHHIKCVLDFGEISHILCEACLLLNISLLRAVQDSFLFVHTRVEKMEEF